MEKNRIQIGIYGVSLLLMGAIGVAGALSTIGANFPKESQTMIQNIVSIPCLVVIPTTLIVGKLMGSMSKKILAIIGTIAFLIGGIVPAFLSSLPLILVFRGILGIGIGIAQPVSSALVAEYFEGADRDKVQGNVQSGQMIGGAVMVFAGGWLGSLSWDKSFYVYLLAIITLILVILCLPNTKPAKTLETKEEKSKVKITGTAWLWVITLFLFFLGSQGFSIYLAYLVDERALGTAAQSGNSLAFFTIAGFVTGLLFGKLAGMMKNLTLFVGLAGTAASYIVIAYAGSLAVVYFGCVLFGVFLSIAVPCIMVGGMNSVDPFSASMLVALLMCGQNLAQFLCPYILNPVLAIVSNGTNSNQLAFIISGGILAAMAVVALIWGIKPKKTAVQLSV